MRFCIKKYTEATLAFKTWWGQAYLEGVIFSPLHTLAIWTFTFHEEAGFEFTNYVNKILAFFDYLPPSVDIFYGSSVDKKSIFSTTYPPFSCKRSLWMPTNIEMSSYSTCSSQATSNPDCTNSDFVQETITQCLFYKKNQPLKKM